MASKCIFIWIAIACLWNNTCGCYKLFQGKDDNSVDKTDRISVKGKWMIDSSGRIRLFHGWNSVQKSPPWLDAGFLNKTTLKYYKDWGFNVVRLGAMWSGFQPTDGATFNTSYTLEVQKIVKLLKENGIYVIMDMHQDGLTSAYSTKHYHGYDGVPLWLVKQFPPAAHPFPWPFGSIGQWAESYITQAVSYDFQCLYSNINNSLQYFENFWKYVALNFRTYKNVLGYELINEPWAGDIYQAPSLLLPGNAGSKNLMPMYNRINQAIRSVDNDTLVFYEPVTWGMLLNGNLTGSGFNSVPGGASYQTKSVFSYHYYCWAITPGDLSKPYPALKRAVCDDILGPLVFETVNMDIKRLGGSSFLTEFGLCGPNKNPNSTSTIECDEVMTNADNHLQSWTYWDGGFFDNQGHISWPKVKGFSRPYARAIAGIPTMMKYNIKANTFRLKYTIDPKISAPTEVFVPPIHYPHGLKSFQVQVSGPVAWTYDSQNNLLLITYSGDKETINEVSKMTFLDVEIMILPK